jgi:hypothetical protein
MVGKRSSKQTTHTQPIAIEGAVKLDSPRNVAERDSAAEGLDPHVDRLRQNRTGRIGKWRKIKQTVHFATAVEKENLFRHVGDVRRRQAIEKPE